MAALPAHVQLRLAQVYAQNPPRPTGGSRELTTPTTRPSGPGTSTSATASGFRAAAREAETTTAQRPTAPANALRRDKLVAAKLEQPLTPARVAKELSEPDPRRRDESGTLQMYRRPTDRNTAATNILVGRRLDVQA